MKSDGAWTRLSAHGLCVRDRRLLLTRIAAGWPEGGRWTLPGGGVEWGEHPADALVREFHEETGLRDITVEHTCGVYSKTYPRSTRGGALHFVSVLYRVSAHTDELIDEFEGSTDAAGWMSESQLDDLPLAELAEYARRLL